MYGGVEGVGWGWEGTVWRVQAENPRHLGFPWQPDMLHKSLKEGHTKQFELIFILRWCIWRSDQSLKLVGYLTQKATYFGLKNFEDSIKNLCRCHVNVSLHPNCCHFKAFPGYLPYHHHLLSHLVHPPQLGPHQLRGLPTNPATSNGEERAMV